MSEEVKILNIDYSDMFVTDNDTFDIAINYYKDGNDIVVKDFDSEYKDNQVSKTITLTFKMPNYDSFREIHEMSKLKIDEGRDLTPYDLNVIQYSRAVVLLKSWSINKPISEFKNVHPKIVKAIIAKILEIIKFDGII